MTQGNLLKRLFPDPNMVYQIYEVAEEIAGYDPFLLQQEALYEMNRDEPDLARATVLLESAIEMNPKSRSIKHTCAELHLRKADYARTELEWSRLIGEAERQCRDLKAESRDSYAYSTLVKAGIQRLSRALEGVVPPKEEDFDVLLRNVERELKEGQQRFPDDSYLLVQEANLATLLNKDNRAFAALQRSFAGNPKNAHVAMHLARSLEERGDIPAAQEVLIKALEATRGNQRMHSIYGDFLFRNRLGTDADLAYHYLNAFTPGDTNFKAQLMYGRQMFAKGDFEKANDVFRILRAARLPYDVKKTRHWPLEKDFTGTVEQVEAYYCEIRCDGAGGVVRFEFDELNEAIDRREIARHMKVTFKIGFCMMGPRALDLRI